MHLASEQEKNFCTTIQKIKEKKVVGKFFLKASFLRYRGKHKKNLKIGKNWPIFTLNTHGGRLSFQTFPKKCFVFVFILQNFKKEALAL